MHWSLLPSVHLFGMSFAESRILMASWIAMAAVILGLWIGIRRMQQFPGGLQNAVEWLYDAFAGLAGSIMTDKGLAYLPLILSIFLYVFACNYIGLVPGLVAPTSNINVPLALAVVVFFSFVVVGIRVQGIGGYVKHLMGPIKFLAPVMIVIESISLLSRPLSLTLRLFANILAGEQIIAVLAGFSGLFLPLVWQAFETFVTCWIQATVFSVLTMIYLGEVLATHHDENHAEATGAAH